MSYHPQPSPAENLNLHPHCRVALLLLLLLLLLLRNHDLPTPSLQPHIHLPFPISAATPSIILLITATPETGAPSSYKPSNSGHTYIHEPRYLGMKPALTTAGLRNIFRHVLYPYL
ncbi:hypothetical protein EX30DRAFT_175867 [Ascodesmis nigricans]|uniref:Uncharacterized protein n=1 Tax=Ascodesmis nigricans TaxID=341454 RepID=A0A4S2MQX5_9PEZI|nr:hypothetical protein EX30DRAFT_175867 [Ascodesmis nigricans]